MTTNIWQLLAFKFALDSMPVRYRSIIYVQNLSVLNNICTNTYILYKNVHQTHISYRQPINCIQQILLYYQQGVVVVQSIIIRSMNQTLPQHVTILSCNHNKLNHKSRKQVEYHVYLYRFISDFKMLSKEEQEVVLVEGGVWDHFNI